MKKHKFNVWDECEKCGIVRRKIPYVADGYNFTLANRFVTEYSKDGINYQKEFINCEK